MPTQAGHDPERGLVDRDRVEQWRDALLEVALVGQRQALEQGQAAGQLPDDAGSAATDQLGRVRVLLVGHHRAAGRERVGDAHEPEPRVRPPGDLLGQPAQVDHAERDGRQGLDHEVAIRDGVERVRADAVEAELRGRGFAIERVAGARERARAQRRDVEAGARVGQAAPVALGHLDVGEQVVGEEDRLGRLDVRCARQDRRPVALGEVDKSPLEVAQRAVELVDRAAGPEPHVRRDLVVAGAAGVEAAGQRPDLLDQGDLDVHVDVFERRVPGRAPGSDVVGKGGEAVDEGLDLVLGQETGPAEAANVGDRTGDVVGGEGGVDLDRAGEVRDPRVRLAAEPSAPGPHRASGRAEVLMLPGGTVEERQRRRGLMLDFGRRRALVRLMPVDAYRSSRDRAGETVPPHPDAPDRPVTRRTVRCAGRRSPRTGTATGLPDRGDPTIVVYLILSKQFVHGLTLGSTKARRRPAP